MASYKINFTKVTLEKIEHPIKMSIRKGGVYDTYYDTNEKGLTLLASNGGAKTFYLYKKLNGRPIRVKLGSFPDMTIEQARRRAVDNRSKINSGENPKEESRKTKLDISFGAMFEEYMERYSKKHKRTWQSDEREINKFLDHWFQKKASTIKKQEIQHLIEKIGDENGLYQANRLFERIRAIYNKSIEWGWNGINPTTGIKKFKEKSRDRFLQPDELPRFFEALQLEENVTIRDCIWILLLTGARKGNALAMRFDEVNFTSKEWRIPDTKNGEALTIPLSDQAMKILIDRRNNATSEFVFPSNSSKKGYIQDLKKAWIRILKEAKLKDLRIHDLRRTLGSWQVATGASLPIIGKSLGHKTQQATAIYARLNLDPVRDSVNKATSAMLALSNKDKI